MISYSLAEAAMLWLTCSLPSPHDHDSTHLQLSVFNSIKNAFFVHSFATLIIFSLLCNNLFFH